jgi:hypothetical protein
METSQRRFSLQLLKIPTVHTSKAGALFVTVTKRDRSKFVLFPSKWGHPVSLARAQIKPVPQYKRVDSFRGCSQ